jgi:transcriptional adapter 2-alpha
MTVTQRKPQHLPDEIQSEVLQLVAVLDVTYIGLVLLALNEPGVQYECDVCSCDLTHSVRIKCADPVCTPGEGVDLCPACFCAGKEIGRHLRCHPYRVIVGFCLYDALILDLFPGIFLGDEFIPNFYGRLGRR